MAGSAQARLRRRRAARAQRPGGLPGSGGQGKDEWGTRGGWRLGEGRRPEIRSYAVTIMAAVTGGRWPCASSLRPSPRQGRHRGRSPPPPSALTVSEAGSAVPSDMAAALPDRPRARRARPSGSGAPQATRLPAASPPARAPAATPLPWQRRQSADPRMWRARPTLPVPGDTLWPTGCAPRVWGGERGGAGTAFCRRGGTATLRARHQSWLLINI